MKIVIFALSTLISLLTLVSCAAITPANKDGQQGALAELNACSSSSGVTDALVTYAQKHGLFAKNGLEVTHHRIAGGSDAVIALIAGDVSLCQMAAPAVINGVLAGEDLVFVAGLDNRQPYWLLTSPDITSAEDLRGKILAVSGPGSGSDTILRSMLKSLGLQPDVDATIVAVGGSDQRLAALESGQIAGTVLSFPESAQAEAVGYHVLLAPGDLKADYQHAAVVTTRAFLEANPQIVAGYVKAVIDATARMKADQEEAVAVIAEALGYDPLADADLLNLAYDYYFHGYLPEKPYPSEAGIQAIIDAARLENPTARDLTAADIIDASIIQELDESGFIDSVYTQSSP